MYRITDTDEIHLLIMKINKINRNKDEIIFILYFCNEEIIVKVKQNQQL